jgi:K+-sensing histidine kinase KdpD
MVFLHDLRNRLATICAGAELLMDLDSPSTQVKRLAAKMCHAAGRMRKLLADVPSITRDNVSSAEVCDIREVIAAASEAALAAKEAIPGGGTVRIGARKTGTSVLVELEDKGPGIPACIYDRLFEPFVTSGKGRPGTWTLASPSEGSQLRLRFVD